jgi:low affinity Fe/Cu permease
MLCNGDQCHALLHAQVTFTDISQHTSEFTGKPLAFIIACVVLLVWLISGPVFHYSDTWQLVINTLTTVITFLMVFLIQATQNRDSLAIQTKLDELIKASNARNEFIGIDKLPQNELIQMREAH